MLKASVQLPLYVFQQADSWRQTQILFKFLPCIRQENLFNVNCFETNTQMKNYALSSALNLPPI